MDFLKTINSKVNQILPFNKVCFLPLFFIMIYGVVGYAAMDKQAPVIESNRVEVLYGTKLDNSIFTITDNRDTFEGLDIELDHSNYNPKKLGTYDVNVKATDKFSNVTNKVVKVQVIDSTAPKIALKNKDNGYVVDVEVNSKMDYAKYFTATDNVDGDITEKIVATKVDTSKLGTQTVNLKVMDSSGNVRNASYELYVTDSKAPVIYIPSKTVTIDYGKKFNYKNYVKIKDNYDSNNIKITTEGKVNTKELNKKSTFKIIATDASGNKSENELSIIVKDKTKPKLSIKKKKVEIKKGSKIDLKSYIASCTDNFDGNMKKDVKITGKVDTKKPGTYTITYSIKDSNGNSTIKKLKVTVYSDDDVKGNGGIVSTVKSRLGCPYVWGKNGPSRFDCSGLTQWVYKKNGIKIPRTTGAQKSAGKVVPLSKVKPGDIVWRSGHVGIYVGGGKVIHAPRPGKNVTYISVNYFKCGVRYKK